jgi:four helix bundle protein
MWVDSVKEFIAYRKSFASAMDIFEATKLFPAEERDALTSQLRRSARSVSLNLREAWAKRRYRAPFISKLTDCDGECAEADAAPDFAVAHGYMSNGTHQEMANANEEVARMVRGMIRPPEKFVLNP